MPSEVMAGLLGAVGLYGVIRYFSRSKTIHGPEAIKWSGWEAIGIVVAVYLASQFIGLFIAARLANLHGLFGPAATDWLQNSSFGQFWLILCVELVVLGLLALFLKRRTANVSSIGLVGRPKLIDVGYVLVGYLVYFVGYLVIITLLKSYLPSLNVDQAQQIGFEHAKGFALVLVLVSLVVLPPLTEEILMRGFLYSGLKNSFNRTWATLITGVLFAAAHLQAGSGAPLLWVAAIDTFVLSFILIQLRERTGGRLWASMGLHALKNSIAFIGLFVLHFAK